VTCNCVSAKHIDFIVVSSVQKNGFQLAKTFRIRSTNATTFVQWRKKQRESDEVLHSLPILFELLTQEVKAQESNDGLAFLANSIREGTHGMNIRKCTLGCYR
jgi:DNA topoisomerase VI subunit A